MQYVLSFSSFTASIFSLGFLSEICTLRAPLGIVTIFTYAAKSEKRCITRRSCAISFDESWAQSTEFLPLCDVVSVNLPSTRLHLVPSPLHIPHLSSIAFESITQSHPTFYSIRNISHNFFDITRIKCNTCKIISLRYFTCKKKGRVSSLIKYVSATVNFTATCNKIVCFFYIKLVLYYM